MKPYHIDDVLITPRRLELRVDELAQEMADGIHSTDLVVIGILRGSFIFMADLVRWFARHDMHPRIDFMIMQSYTCGTEGSRQPAISRDCSIDVRGADVVLVDDILDTGRTLKTAVAHIKDKGAKSVRTCVLLDKPDRRAVEMEADYVGFRIDDVFVVGYGLDYNGHHRELPHIAKVTFLEEPGAHA